VLDPLPWDLWRIVAADVDGNDEIQSYDAALILQYATGIITQFPVEMGRETHTPPLAAVTVECIDGMMNFYADGALYGLELDVTNNSGVGLGEPVCGDDNAVVWLNNTGRTYSLAMCSATAMGEDTCILQIPYTLGEAHNPELTLTLTANTKQYELNIDMSQLNATPPIVLRDEVYDNYPNPFNPETTIKLAVLNDNTPVKIDIYNARGQKVAQLVNQVLNSGYHEYVWDGKDSNNRLTGSGVYFYKSQIGNKSFINKMLLVK
jgi:hypothetical protein